jgi:hypothetical protein
VHWAGAAHARPLAHSSAQVRSECGRHGAVQDVEIRSRCVRSNQGDQTLPARASTFGRQL